MTKCKYCEYPTKLVECTTCYQHFCNSRSLSSISHIIFHLVKTKHKTIKINEKEIVCSKCSEDNIFKLVTVDSKYYCKECKEGASLIEERCLTIIDSPSTISLTKQQMASIEEKTSYILPSVQSKFKADEYVKIFTCLIDAECEKEKEIKESMKQSNVVVRWENSKFGYFYFHRTDSDLKINIGDEIRLTHKSGLNLTGFISNDSFTEELKFEVDQSGEYPRSGYTIEYIWRGVCYERMKWALNKLYNIYIKKQTSTEKLNNFNNKNFNERDLDENSFNNEKDYNENKKISSKTNCKDKKISNEFNYRDKITIKDSYSTSKKENFLNDKKTSNYSDKEKNSNNLLTTNSSLFEYILTGKKESMNTNIDIEMPPNLPTLNKYQITAVKAAMTRQLTLIQGPPGTGKTLVSASIVYNYIKKNKGKVLVVAPSNTAVDQLTLKIHKTGLKVLRVMSRRREYTQSDVNFLSLHENVKELQKTGTEEESDYLKRQLLHHADVITCTCVTAGQKMFNRLKFSCVLIDEAVQSTEPLSIIPLVYGCTKLILVGDHKQLGPTILSKKVAKAGFKQSLFERLITIGVFPYKLSLQYRMHPDLCEWPSETFYNGELFTGNRQFYRNCTNIPFNFFYACYGKEEVSASGTSFVNPMEALYCESIIRHLFKSGITENQIGVITPYEGQRSHILNRIFGSEPGNLEISNVDGFQGREKDFIIVSLVRSNLFQGIGFVGDKRRMNVALTRAKHGLIIIGNPNTLIKHEMWKSLLQFYDKRELILEGPLGDLKSVALNKPKKVFDFRAIAESIRL